MSERELPEGWIEAQVSDITVRVPNVKPENEPEREFGYIDISSIDRTRSMVREGEVRRFLGKDAPSRARRPVQPGDVLFSNVRTNLRNIALLRPGVDASLCSTGFTVLRSNAAMMPDLLLRWVLTDAFTDTVTETQTGTHYPATSDAQVLAQRVLFPPLPEQRRIVEKVEALLAEVNAARDRLAKVPGILKRFRQAVLAAACSGRLTEEWRSSAGLVSVGLVNPAEYQDDEEIAERSNLPGKWRQASFGQVIEDSFYGPRFSGDQYGGNGIPTVRTTDMDFRGNICLEGAPRIAISEEQFDRFGLIDGDLLVTRTGATIGKCALYRASLGKAIPSAYLIRFRLRTDVVLPDFALVYLQSPIGQQLLGIGQTSVAQSNVNARTISRFPIPLPPLDEQTEIVRRVEALFAVADEIEKQVATATTLAEKLPQAILAKAFRGELVPTEADLARAEGRTYESAEELLARVRAEREKAGETGKTKGKKAKAATGAKRGRPRKARN